MKHIEITLDVDDEKGAGMWSYLSPSPRNQTECLQPPSATDAQIDAAVEAARNEDQLS